MSPEQNKSPPWKFSYPCHIVDSNGRWICRLDRAASFDKENEEGHEALTHGYLIAAAPELLEALELAQRIIKQSGTVTGPDVNTAINAAIAKARGQQ
jgi:hypothetical protein